MNMIANSAIMINATTTDSTNSGKLPFGTKRNGNIGAARQPLQSKSCKRRTNHAASGIESIKSAKLAFPIVTYSIPAKGGMASSIEPKIGTAKIANISPPVRRERPRKSNVLRITSQTFAKLRGKAEFTRGDARHAPARRPPPCPSSLQATIGRRTLAPASHAAG